MACLMRPVGKYIVVIFFGGFSHLRPPVPVCLEFSGQCCTGFFPGNLSVYYLLIQVGGVVGVFLLHPRYYIRPAVLMNFVENFGRQQLAMRFILVSLEHMLLYPFFSAHPGLGGSVFPFEPAVIRMSGLMSQLRYDFLWVVFIIRVDAYWLLAALIARAEGRARATFLMSPPTTFASPRNAVDNRAVNPRRTELIRMRKAFEHRDRHRSMALSMSVWANGSTG